MFYSIIIPVYNEAQTLDTLLSKLKIFHNSGHEIVIVDDGSTDNSSYIFKNHPYISLIKLNRNCGKGIALRKGLKYINHKKVIVYDGDLELDVLELSKFMFLSTKITSLMGTRYPTLRPAKSGIDWGNFMFTVFFNLVNRTCHKDILCCAKSFYIKDIPIHKLKSEGFDIDIEISSFLSKNSRGKKIIQIPLKYKRRSIKDGKKLRILDGWSILKRILFTL